MLDTLRLRGYVVLEDQSNAVVSERLGRSGPPTLLRPRGQNLADPWSLSGVYGLGKFPWHTDGAIAADPPRWVVMRAVHVSEPTCTELLDPPTETRELLRRTLLRTENRIGRIRYLPAAVPSKSGRLRIRWDPRTCKPRTGLTIEDMERNKPTMSIDWRQNRLLVIDNSRFLHRRPAVGIGVDRLIERRYVWDK